jgi:hypothetical protein
VQIGNRQVARHRAQQHALAQPPQAALERVFVVAVRTGQRARHFIGTEGGARATCRIGLGGQLGTRGQRLHGIARKVNFPNRIRHLRIKWMLRLSKRI